MIVDRFLHPTRNGKVWDWAEAPDGMGLSEVIGPMDVLRNLGDSPIETMSKDDASFLCHLGMEFLGVGNADAVDRYADSIGVKMGPLLNRLGNQAGISYDW